MQLRTEGLTWQEIDGELVILDLENSTYLTTNEAGAILAKALTNDRSPRELEDLLVDTFGIGQDQARADATAFVKQLDESRLLA